MLMYICFLVTPLSHTFCTVASSLYAGSLYFYSPKPTDTFQTIVSAVQYLITAVVIAGAVAGLNQESQSLYMFLFNVSVKDFVKPCTQKVLF